MADQIIIISDLLKKNPSYEDAINHLEERLYNRYMVYLSDKPKFNEKTSVIPKPYLVQIISFKNTLELNKISKKYNLTQEQRDIIPNILWRIFYREAEIKNLPQMINSELNINNIKTSYQISTDIANLYMPISDYLGDISMVIKKWQYEMPVAEPTISDLIKKPQTPPQASQNIPAKPVQQSPVATQAEPTPIAPPPIRQAPAEQAFKLSSQPQPAAPAAQPTQNIGSSLPAKTPVDESIPKVQETLSRIVAASNRITSQIQKAAQEQAKQIPPVQPQSTQQVPQSQSTSHTSDLEPEYLPDDNAVQKNIENPSVNKANVIDLKNF